jgi:hypothetical protein
MSKFIVLGVALAMLAAGASAKTLKVTKSEVVVQHRGLNQCSTALLPPNRSIQRS